jgi:DNA-binding NtrC family response regulator
MIPVEHRNLEDLTKNEIEDLLRRHDGNQTDIATVLRKTPRTVYNLLRKHGIDAAQFRPAPKGLGAGRRG